MEKKNKEEKNPFHKEYGVFSNSGYILKNMLKNEKRLWLLIPLGIITAPVMQYLWTFLSKIVIDMISNRAEVENLIITMAVFTVVQMSSTMLSTYYHSEVWWRYIATRFRLIVQKNRKIMSLDFECLEDADLLDCYQKAGNATNSNGNGVEGMMHNIVEFMITLAVVAVGFVILGQMNILVVVVMLMLSVLDFLIRNRTSRACKKKVWDPLSLWWRKNGYMTNATSDFSFAKDIRMFGLADWLTKKIRELKAERIEAQKKNQLMWLHASWASSVIFAISQALTYAWLFYMVYNGQITVGNFSLYLGSAVTLYSYLGTVFQTMTSLFETSREVDDFRSFLDFKSDKNEQGEDLPELSEYNFEFKNVSFKYPRSESYALKNLSLKLESGKKLAVVGLNGAGKTTFIKLLLRLYEPCEGEILLNGVNIRKYNKESYYKLFSPVFQNVELFAFPLAENVSMDTPENTDKKKAEKCLSDAGFAEKLSELPKGVDTEILKVIYDDGVDLSGGEKQKLALARALYKDAPVVILDEPTAALDALAESRLYESFDKLIGGKTAVYISHRLSSTQFCSEVAMFRDGEMVEYGTHKELMRSGGAYAEMFKIQAQYYVDSPESEVAVNA